MYCDSTIPTDASGPDALGAATRSVMRLVLALVEESAAGAARLSDHVDSRAGWQELRNKIEAFRAFEHVDSLLGAPMCSPLPVLLARAVALRRPLNVWAAEGLGYHMTAARPAGRGLLQRADLDEWALIPLHAGMGSAIAASVLEPILQGGADFDVARRAIAAFDAACRANAEETHLGVAREALGFAVRAMYAELTTLISAVLEAERPELVPSFWHGAGRAMYFAPTAACPMTRAAQHGLDEALMSPPPGERANAVAGFAWAATLVNLRHPYVVERFVSSVAGRPRWTSAACAGIQSALEVWRRCAPDDRAIDDYLGHQPHSAPARDAWYRVVVASPPQSAVRAGDLFTVAAAAGAATT